MLDELLRFPTGKLDNKVDVCSLIGMAIDQAHPAIAPIEDTTKNDRWDKAFDKGEDCESWRT